MEADKELPRVMTGLILYGAGRSLQREDVIGPEEAETRLLAWRNRAVVAAGAGLKSYVDKYPNMTLKEYWDGKHQKQTYTAAELTKEEGAL